jgi:uncharacterized repeat protein (TIGR01451 family)
VSGQSLSNPARSALAWTQSTDTIGVAGYRIYRGGVQLASTKIRSYTDLAVVAGSSYTYTVRAYDLAGNLSSHSNSVTVIPGGTSGADLRIDVFDSPDPVTVGGNITYTATVMNDGPASAANVAVNNSLPSTLAYVSASSTQGTCTTGSAITCTIGTLASGAGATVTIVARTLSVGTALNTIGVSSSTPDPSAANNSLTTSTTVFPGGGGGTSAAPSSVAMVAGTIAGGTLASLVSNDDDHFHVAANQTQGVSDWYGTFTGLPTSPATLTVTYAVKSTATCTQTLYLWHWSYSTWTPLETGRSVGTAEVAVDVAVPSTLEAFISGGTARVRLRCTATPGSVHSTDRLGLVYS